MRHRGGCREPVGAGRGTAATRKEPGMGVQYTQMGRQRIRACGSVREFGVGRLIIQAIDNFVIRCLCPPL